MSTVVQFRALTKQFDGVTALDSVDLTLQRPSIVGLLGKNGSGKTTLIRHLMGLQLPDAGSVTTLGQSSGELEHEQLARIGYVPQEIRLLDWMTVEQHLRYVACFYPSWDGERERRLIEQLELEVERPVGALSIGNLQKLAIVSAGPEGDSNLSRGFQDRREILDFVIGGTHVRPAGGARWHWQSNLGPPIPVRS